MEKWLKDLYDKLEERYRSGEVPWDDEIPPPEVIDLVKDLSPGKALDLGSGYGRTSIYLAQHGWQVDGIDFIPDAAAEAAKRSRSAAVNVRFHIASVLDLDFLAGPYNLAIDIGCGHNLSEEGLNLYHDHLRRLLDTDGYFLLFARLRGTESADNEAGPSGIDHDYLVSTFSPGFELEWSTIGETEVEDNPPWPSGWFRFAAR